MGSWHEGGGGRVGSPKSLSSLSPASCSPGEDRARPVACLQGGEATPQQPRGGATVISGVRVMDRAESSGQETTPV